MWFKKQRYHCVYEYPKETLATETQGESTNTWESTSYSGKFIFFLLKITKIILKLIYYILYICIIFVLFRLGGNDR